MQDQIKRSVKDLMGKNIVVFDEEIKNVINSKDPADPKVGWPDKHLMGISVAVAFDYRDWCFKIYMDDNIHELSERLNEPNTLAVGFNIIDFDLQLQRRDHVAAKVPLREDIDVYDMLIESRLGAKVGKFEKNFKLQDHLMACGLPIKNGDGADAPMLWKTKQLGKLITYTVNDAKTEKGLFEYMYVTGKCSTTNFKNYDVRIPNIVGR